MNRESFLILVVFIIIFQFSEAQEKVCVPNVWKGETVKGMIYLENGDSLKGKFTHLTPYNDIKTTHIIYKGDKKGKQKINRKEIVAYYDKKVDEYRLKVYVDDDSVFVKKNCFFDQGRFLLVLVKGKYTLVKDELTYRSSISAYSQSSANDVYYILPPDGNLVEVQVNELKAQMLSLLKKGDDKEMISGKTEYSINDMIELLQYLNSN